MLYRLNKRFGPRAMLHEVVDKRHVLVVDFFDLGADLLLHERHDLPPRDVLWTVQDVLLPVVRRHIVEDEQARGEFSDVVRMNDADG
ncbi:hypothetical protein HYQ46_000530 [Verticillium longisporum]|nr:hypothetical protein HYQ46_000530 [Verticillium longisporum]